MQSSSESNLPGLSARFTRLASVVLTTASLIVGCAETHPTVPYDHTELAMERGAVITASNANGTVQIEWLSPLQRKYTWDEGETAIVTLWPRKERFRGKLGAYHPAPRSFFDFWSGPRVVAEDSQIDFKTQEELDAFLVSGSSVLDWVYNDEGWVVGFAKSPDRENQVNVAVYRVTIDGKAPDKIAGSRSAMINVSGAGGA